MQTSTRLLTAAILTVLSTSAMAAGPAERALAQLRDNSAVVRGAAGDVFKAKATIVDANAAEHVRFDRTYRGLPVIGGDFVTHARNGVMKGASVTLASTARPGLAGRLSADQAVLAAGTDFGTGFNAVSNADKVIYARSGDPRLAYEVVYSGVRADQTPTEMHYFVDAESGRILDKWDAIHTGKPGGGGTTCSGTTSSAGTGRTLYAGNVVIDTQNCGTSFQMKDLTRGGGYTTDMANGTRGTGTIFSSALNVWGDNTVGNRASAAADAHLGVAATWDYFKNVHGRNGIANDNKGALSKVHYGRNYVNAFWSDSTFSMTFGDGDGVTYGPLVNLDVAGHEMTHGVTSRSANLVYSGESGGLNEATSDIFGTMVEFAVNNANDVPDYLIGEEIYLSNPGLTKAFRYMYNPELEGAGTRSKNCWSSTLNSIDVHYSSGPANHFFYLLAEGSAAKTFANGTITSPTCNGSSVTGIGRAAAEKIWYRALTVYMTSSTNYAGARAATLSAAADLSYSTAAVAAAWSAVNVN
ncbi:MAG: M4 family metallopeptidase [Pseudomonadota bacterium]|nr:M4 family metallopeptidase [Pseudomonadota bacterium]